MGKEMAWVVSANMGLGHQRATYPLKEIAVDKVRLFGEEELETVSERRLWRLFRDSYEFISRTRQVPIIGRALYSMLERMQNISPYYPFRDQSHPSLQVKSLYSLIKKGMGHSLCNKLSSRQLPVVTSFYAAAIALEELTELPVYCIICDSEINRVWVAENPEKSRIIYFVPCGSAMRRLKEYGVPDERIFITGFPLPKENLGGLDMPILKKDLAERLIRLDPTEHFHIIHEEEVKLYLGCKGPISERNRPLTVTYAVGGAGAQAEIVQDVLASFAPEIRAGRINLNLAAGTKSKVNQYFHKLVGRLGLQWNKNLQIIYSTNAIEYFNEFSRIMHTTDVLWTKPSELSFYCGLGIPIIISPSIGPHEVCNSHWLQEIGAGLPQEDTRYCSEWIMDHLYGGRLAQMAWDGFLYARKMGAYKIEEVLTTGMMVREISPIKR